MLKHKYISAVEMEQKSADEKRLYRRVTKKYALADFYDNEFGDLVIASDSMEEIKKSAEQYRKDTDGECLLMGLQWSDGGEGYEMKWNF